MIVSHSTTLPKNDDEFRSVGGLCLRSTPEVNEFLVDIRLGALRSASTRSVYARIPNWIGHTEKGVPVFVKKLTGRPGSVLGRTRRIVAHQRFAADCHDDALKGPRCLGWDLLKGLVAFECLDDAVTGTALVDRGGFGTVLGERLGRSIGSLHRAAPSSEVVEVVDDSRPPMPSTRPLEGLSEGEYDNSSYAMRQVWRMLQSDRELHRAVTRLLANEAAAPRTLAHCDLRVDQLLVSGERLYVNDWEEFRMADPARDVGSYAGEWLYRSALDMGEAPESATGDASRDAVDTGARALERLRPPDIRLLVGISERSPELGHGSSRTSHRIRRLAPARTGRLRCPALVTRSRQAAGRGGGRKGRV